MVGISVGRREHRLHRLHRLSLLLVTVLLGVGSNAVFGPPAAWGADPTASMSVQKSADVSAVVPGQTFDYTIQVQCTAGTVNGCVNAQLVDPLPEYLQPNGAILIAGSPSTPAIGDGPPITVTFADDLGGGAVGLAPGNIITITIPVVVSDDIPVSASGQPLVNTASITADNADPKQDDATVTPNVPSTLNAATTKDIQPPGDLAVPGTPLTVALTGTNTSNVPVDTLVIQDPVNPDATPSPFLYLGVTGLGDVTLPAGAETVQVSAYVSGAWVDGPVGPPAALPDGVDPTDISGLRWTFTSTDGDGIPPGAGTSVGIDMAQRDSVADLTDPVTITNDADTTVVADADSATSAPASDTYRIPPTSLDITPSKAFNPDTVRAGDPSTVTLGAVNNSEVPLDTLTITEPKPGTPNPFSDSGLTFDSVGSDASGAGIVWPDGATGATVKYTGPGCPGDPQEATAPDTLPGPPAGCTVTGFAVTFQGPINPGAQATIPFLVTTSPDQDVDELTRDNTVAVSGTSGPVTQDVEATDSITSIVDRIDVNVGKTLIPDSIPSWPGEIVTAELTGQVEPFPATTVDATQIIVQDPQDFTTDQWYDAFDPQSVIATPVPGCAHLTVQYTANDGATWVDVPGMTNIAGATIFNGVFPPEVSTAATGIRFVYTADPAGGSCTGGFPPGTSVKPNISYSLEEDQRGSDATITDCAASSATDGTNTAQAGPACDDMVLVPPDEGAIDPIDKTWDLDLLNARSQQQSGATLSWSTAGYTGIGRVDITDTQNPGTTPLPASAFDAFDLVRIDPITAATDPLLTYDQITSVQLYQLPTGSTDPAAGSWVDPADDPCPAACDGTFPGYTLTPDQQASTIGFRLTYVESPTRVNRLGTPGAPPVGTGVAASTGNDRHLHPVFQLRDELRSDSQVPVTQNRVYNVVGSPGVIDNTVRMDPYVEVTDPDPIITRTADDTINLVDVPVTVNTTKTWAGGPLGIPETGVPQDEYPTARVTLTGSNTTPAKIDTLVIADPTAGTTPFDTFNLAGFTQLTPPGDIGAADVTVTLTPGPGGQTDYTRDQALALTETQLVDVTAITITYTGRINAADGATVPTATVQFDTRLRATDRSSNAAPQPGATIGNAVTTTGSDLVGYPGVIPTTGTDNAAATIDLIDQGIDVQAGKSFDPATLTEPATGPVTVQLTGQPSGPSRTVQMVLTDTATTFWNAYDLLTLNPVTLVAPIDRVQVDAFTGGTWSVDGGGNPVLTGGIWTTGEPTAGSDLALPSEVTPEQVQGLRFTFNRADGANWENPATPTQPVTFQVQRRDTLQTGGPVLPDLPQNPPSPGETASGVATNTVTADVTSSDVDANGDPLTGTDDAAAPINYHHSRNAVQVQKTPNGNPEPPGSPFSYTLTVTNTGDTDIVDPVITDRLPQDALGPQVVLADPTDYAFAITGGAGMPADPADVTITETPAQLVFAFPAGSTLPPGATYTITFKVVLRPGLPADTQFTNEFGVVADRPWDGCGNGGTNIPDRVTGECATSATNTVLSAGAISVNKKVKAEGSDQLGVIIDPLASAESCVPDADGFYARPCVPVAEPGGDITWRWEFVNTGNRPIDRILGIDRLPAPGDTVAIAPILDRGSQWQPLLTGARPALVGPGALNVYYTTATTGWCDQPQAADGELLCSGLNWVEWPAGQALPVAAATVTGLQVEVLPDGAPLPPAGTIDLDVAMASPPYSPTDTPTTESATDVETIAFNSVGSAGRWTTDATTGYTLTTEPPRVGVALADGPLRLVKTTAGDAAGQYAPDSFAVTLSCISAGVPVPLPSDIAAQTVAADTPITVYNLPYHAICTVGEGANGQTSSTSTTAIVQQDIADVQTATLTNIYEFASLSVTKAVDSDAVDQNGTPVDYGPFVVAVTCSYLDAPVYADGYGPLRPMTAELNDTDTVTFDGLPAGAQCTIAETDDKGAATTIIETTVGTGVPTQAQPIELAPDVDGKSANSATVTNTFGDGSVSLVKQVTGEVAGTYGAGPFTLAMTCVLDDASGVRTVWDGTVTVIDGQTQTIDNLAAGADCTVSEPNDGGASTVTISPEQPVVIGDGQTVTVTATNSFDPARILLTKVVTGDAARYAATSFPVEVTCTANGEVLPGFPVTVAVTPGEQTVVPTLAGATCTAVETDSGQATEVTYDPPATGDDTGSGPVDVGVAVNVDPDATITITNDYRSGGLQILKELDGPGAALAAGPFDFTVTCAFNGVEDAFTQDVTLTRDNDSATLQSEPITGLPVGAVCLITESGTGGADLTAPPVTVTIPDIDDAGLAQVVVAGFVNPFSAGQLQVSKVLTGDAADQHTDSVFTLAVTCQIDIEDTRVTLYSGSVQISGGQTLTVTGASGSPVLLPAGAHCYAQETDTGGADATSIDHDSYDTAVIVDTSDELQTVTITATNTFDATTPTPHPQPPAPTPTPPAPLPLPNTGFPLTGWLQLTAALLAAGTLLLIAARRRQRDQPGA